jgi:hypothetical protein
MALVDFTNPAAAQWYSAQLERLLDQGVDAFKTDFGERIPNGRRLVRRLRPRADAQLLHAPVQPDGVRPAGAAAGDGRGGAVRAVGHRRRPAVPGALGRRLRFHLRLHGRDAARRTVPGGQRFRLLVPRHRRLRGHPGQRSVQALVGVRAAVQSQPVARIGLVPGAVGVRRRGRARRPEVHPAEAVADAVPGGHGAAGPGVRHPDAAADGAGVPARPGDRARRHPVHAGRLAAGRAGLLR